MYNIISFALIILIPMFLMLIFTTDIRLHYRTIGSLGLVILSILTYMFFPLKLPIKDEVLERSRITYSQYNDGPIYESEIRLIKPDQELLIKALKDQRFTHNDRDNRYYLSDSAIFEWHDMDTHKFYTLVINKSNYSSLQINKRMYQFKASNQLSELATKLTTRYSGIKASPGTRGLAADLTLLDIVDDELKYAIQLETYTSDIRISEVNVFKMFDPRGGGLSHLINGPEVTHFQEEFSLYETIGESEHKRKLILSQLIIRGYYQLDDETQPFLVIMDLVDHMEKEETSFNWPPLLLKQ